MNFSELNFQRKLNFSLFFNGSVIVYTEKLNTTNQKIEIIIFRDPTRTDDSNLSNVAQGKVSSLQSVTTNNSDDEAKARKTKESKTGLAKLIEKAKQIVNDQSQVRRKKFTKKVKKNPTVEQHPELSTDEDDDLPLATMTKSRRLSLNHIVAKLHERTSESASSGVENGRETPQKTTPIPTEPPTDYKKLPEQTGNGPNSEINSGSSSESVLHIDFSPAAIKKRVSNSANVI